VARKQKRRNWTKTFLILVLTPVVLWGFAFVIWFYWYDLQGWLGSPKQSRVVTKQQKKFVPGQPVPKRSEEKILDEDRKALEALLKERTR
jgi:hypothetical protein